MSTAPLPPPPSFPTSGEVGNSSTGNETGSSSSRILTNKVQNAISLNTATPSFASALTALSTLQSPTKIDSRSIRTAIEQDALHQAKCLEDEMKRLVGVVQEMRLGIKNVVSIAESVKDSMREVVPHDGKQSMDSFEEERKLAEVLAGAFQERNEAKIRFESIKEFMEKFDLSENDSALLENYNFENVLEHSSQGEKGIKEGMEFLDALNRVSKIRRQLSSSFDSNKDYDDHFGSSNKLGPASAMRMVENLASKQDQAFERLYHFLHSRLDLSNASVAHVPTSSSAGPAQPIINIQDGMDETLLHPFIRKSIVVLRQVPAYYKHTLELISTIRRAEITRKFLLALTSGYDGMDAIEMKAHDPVNYVGDMLAFVFRTMSVESELAIGLFKDEDDIEVMTDDSDAMMSASDVLNDIVSGVARPLRSRLAQVIDSLARRPEDDAEHNIGGLHDEEAGSARARLSSLFSICGLLLFYHSAMEKLAKKLQKQQPDTEVKGSTDGFVNSLVQCVTECLTEGAKGYVASLKVYIATLDSFTSQSNTSRSAVASELMIRLCQVRGASPGYGIDYGDIPEDVSNILSVEFLCETVMEDILPSCNELQDAITSKLALNSMKKIGLNADIARKWDQIISEKEQHFIDSEIEKDTKNVMDDFGLGELQSAMETLDAVFVEGMTASSHPGLSEESILMAMKVLKTTLYDPPIPSYSNIKDPVLRKYARNKVADNVVAVYAKLHNLVQSEKGGYSNKTFLPYDPSQIKAMISS